MPRLFSLAASLVLACPALAQPDIVAKFNNSAQGWSVYGDGESFLWDNAFGHGPGSIYADDGQKGTYWGFSAGPSFLGDKSAYVGGRLSWEVWVSAINDTDPDEPDVWLISSGLTLVKDMGDPSDAGEWVKRSIIIWQYAGWRVGTLAGPFASPEDFIEVMSDLDELRIRAEYRVGADEAWLDNVILEPTLCYSDCDHNLQVDLFDFLCFVNAFNAEEGYADCDENGFLDLFDFLCYTNSFNLPCI